jgi:hypothetical protein
MNTLKPCPFCPDGGDVQLVTFTGGVDDVVHCHTCGTILKHKIWQTRPIEDDLRNRIAELEALVDELKPYRDGYDAYEDFPEEGENVIANLGSWLFFAQRRGDKWYDSLGQQAEIRGGVERWWTLPESPNDTQTQTIVYGKESEE